MLPVDQFSKVKQDESEKNVPYVRTYASAVNTVTLDTKVKAN